jgi:hypothetical protein
VLSLEGLCAGAFIHFDCQTTVPPKPKLAFVAAVEPHRALVFLINSELQEFIKLRPDLLAQHVCLSASEYGFLRYDSWLDCTSVHTVLPEALSSATQVGAACASLCAQVAAVASSSRTINRRAIAAITAAFGNSAG